MADGELYEERVLRARPLRCAIGLTLIIDVVLRMAQDLERAHEVQGVHARVQCE